MLLLKCTGYESALTPVHFNDNILCNTELTATVKRFGLKTQISWVGTTNDCLNDNDIRIANLLSMCLLNAKRPHTPILT